jgi:hypothetical protein
MNRENYDPRVLSTFDVIGSYFVDIFYNDLYLKAKDKVKEGRYAAVTDAYKANIVNYMHGIKKRELYKTVALSLHEYYQKVTSYNTLLFAEFETRILSHFIPDVYFKDFTESDKDCNLFSIITNTVLEFGEALLAPKSLKMIIDDHRNEHNIRILQDTIVDILKTKREEYYVQFAKKINQRSGKVSEEVVKKLKDKIIEETRKRCSAEQDRDRLLEMVKQLMTKVSVLTEENNKLKASQSSVNSIADFISEPRKQRKPRARKAPTPPPVEDSSSESEDEYEKQREALRKKVEERRKLSPPKPIEVQIETPAETVSQYAEPYDNVESEDDDDDDESPPAYAKAPTPVDDDPGFGGF